MGVRQFMHEGSLNAAVSCGGGCLDIVLISCLGCET